MGIACAIGSYEIYRLVFPIDTETDSFIRCASFMVENFLTDAAVDTLGMEVFNHWISLEMLRNLVCKIVLTK